MAFQQEWFEGNPTHPAFRFKARHEDLAPGDYASPKLILIKPDPCFPQMVVGNVDNIRDPLFRREIAHTWRVDKNFPDRGFLSRDEAIILFNAALNFRDKSALEIGSHVGWSTLHIALAGVKLDTIEAQLNNPMIFLPLMQSLMAAGINPKVSPVAGLSPGEVERLAGMPQNKRWSFAFIDGDHAGEAPRRDAMAVSKYMTETAMVFFHDLVFPDVARGLEYFAQLGGWRTRIYHTQQIMGVAWRGDCAPPVHQPDPNYEWSLPYHLRDLYRDDGSSRY